MAIPLSNQRRWQFAAGVTFVACVYIFLTGTEYAASVFASRAELPSLERAVRLSPGNADYRHRLRRYFSFLVGDSQSGTSLANELHWIAHYKPSPPPPTWHGKRPIFFLSTVISTAPYANSTSSSRTTFRSEKNTS